MPRLPSVSPACRALIFTAALVACRSNPAIEAQESPAHIASYTLDPTRAFQFRLPGRLREISGLATTADGRIFAHNDERAVIYEIDLAGERLVKAFGLGDPVARNDFEGIAIVDDRFYLVSSEGRLFESFEGEDDERVLFNTYGTGVGRHCEVEGLAFEPIDETFLLLCKTPRDDALAEYVAIYRWSLRERGMATDSLIRIPREAFTAALPGRSFHPSGIEREPRTGNYFIVAAREEAIAVVTPSGEVVSVASLPDGIHRQPEGITFTTDRKLVIADEGGSRRARLTMYPPTPEGEEDTDSPTPDPPTPEGGNAKR